MLFLDEATSSLDPATERDLVATLEGLKGAHTVIVVSHRLSTVERCDRIYVMDEGRIVGEGAYEELARTNPGFRSWAGLDNPS